LIPALLLAGALLADRADALHQEALALLLSGDAAEAEARSLEAVALSQKFVAEQEIEARPERGLLFDEMILKARRSYRERRAGYFRTLGDALAAQEKWRESRKAYRRALGMGPIPGLSATLARQPDLDLPRRLDLLFDAYLSPGADRAELEREILATSAFLDRNALKAGLDRKRFPKLAESFPDLELLDGWFPDFQATADGGPLIPSQLYRAGVTLVAYFPVDGCGRCSEELDGLALPFRDAQKRKLPLEAAAFVPERDLPVARRIARLLSLPVRVAKRDFVPASADVLEDGEIRVVGRGGMTQIRIPMAEGLASREIRPRVEAVLAFLGEPGLPTEARPEDASVPLVRLTPLSDRLDERRAFAEWVGTIDRLEAGPANLESFYSEVNRLAQRIAPKDRAETIGLLEELSRIEGAHAAKSRFLGLLGERAGERLLEAAKALDPSVARTPAGEEGVFQLAVDGPRVLVQRSFHAAEGLRDFDFVLEDGAGLLAVAWAAPQEKRPRGVQALDNGAAFFFEGGARLWAGGNVVFEGERVDVVNGALVEIRSALVDAPKAGPAFFRRAGEGGESALETGLRLFRGGDFPGAHLAFGKAEKEIDPEAPYDASDLAYNRARALQEQGKRLEALALFRTIGDVTYQNLVDEKARAIESGR
jgi:tetratricopeptide (TPR) repeat protein